VPPAAAPAASSGPGEYTRLFGSAAGTFVPPEPAPAPPVAAPPAAAPAPAPAARASRLPLFLILGFVLLMMVAVVLYFLLRK
jgi:hypothetical protein